MIKTLNSTIEADPPISVHYSKYSNNALIILTQLNKLGTIIRAEIENPEALDEEKVFNVEVKFGDRCNDFNLALARSLVERLNIGNIMLIISLTDKNSHIFNLIVESLLKLIV